MIKREREISDLIKKIKDLKPKKYPEIDDKGNKIDTKIK